MGNCVEKLNGLISTIKLKNIIVSNNSDKTIGIETSTE